MVLMRVRSKALVVTAVAVTVPVVITAAVGNATVPARVTPSPMAPPFQIAVRDTAGDVGAGDLDIRSVRVYRSVNYCGGPCPGPVDGHVGAVFTVAKPIRNNAIYSVMLTSAGRRFQIAAKRAAGVDSFFVFRFRDSKNIDRFVWGSFRGRVVRVDALISKMGFDWKQFRFAATAEPTNGRRGGTDRAPNGSKTIAYPGR
jgi:hypothetical protein